MGGPAFSNLVGMAQSGDGGTPENPGGEIKTTIADLEGNTVREKNSRVMGGFKDRQKTGREAEIDKMLLERMTENEADYEAVFKNYQKKEYPGTLSTGKSLEFGSEWKAQSYKDMPIDWLQAEAGKLGSKKKAAKAGGTVLTQDSRLAEAFDLAGGNS